MKPDLKHLVFWQDLDKRTQLLVGANILAVIVGGLAIDAAFGWPGQIAAIVWTFCVWGWLFKVSGKLERRALILCTVIASFGEIGLSLVWGVYNYQFYNVPLFVPPGHALLTTLGILIARRIALPLAWSVCAIAAVWALVAWFTAFDQFGAVLFLLFAFCMFVSTARTLYATMFVMALIMELYATAIGNWTWVPITPLFGTTASNPPFSAGAFYCLLDLLVLASLRGWARLAMRTSPTS
jgi:xanthosine utilization system XapX-like protein